jgi:CBS domain-containing protein
MNVGAIMTRHVQVIGPEETVQEAAWRMVELDVGILPVEHEGRLVGVVTDRDIAVRSDAAGKDPRAVLVGEVMSSDVECCFENDDVGEIARRMGELRVRRLPVLDAERRSLVGIVSLGDIATAARESVLAGAALTGIVEPGGPHSQTGLRAFVESEPAVTAAPPS